MPWARECLFILSRKPEETHSYSPLIGREREREEEEEEGGGGKRKHITDLYTVGLSEPIFFILWCVFSLCPPPLPPAPTRTHPHTHTHAHTHTNTHTHPTLLLPPPPPPPPFGSDACLNCRKEEEKKKR